VIVVMAFIIRCDHCGVSSVVRWLFLNPDYYDPLLRFFRTTSWQLEPLLASWVTIAMSSFPIPEFNGRPLLIGDTIKVDKEAYKMPEPRTAPSGVSFPSTMILLGRASFASPVAGCRFRRKHFATRALVELTFQTLSLPPADSCKKLRSLCMRQRIK
jgi:hypothetical protein